MTPWYSAQWQSKYWLKCNFQQTIFKAYAECLSFMRCTLPLSQYFKCQDDVHHFVKCYGGGINGAKCLKWRIVYRQNLNDGMEHDGSMKNALLNFPHKLPAILKLAEDNALKNASHKVTLNCLNGPAQCCVITNFAPIRFRVEDELSVCKFLFSLSLRQYIFWQSLLGKFLW